MNRLVVFSLFAFVLLGNSGLCQVTPVERVGRYGDIANLIVQGAEIVGAERVRKEVAEDFDVILAGHPSAPLDAFLPVLRRRLYAGYRYSGFPDAEVELAIDRENKKIVASIVEGQQFWKGDVRVVGGKKIDTAALVKRITEKFPPPGASIDSFSEQKEGATRWVDVDGKEVKLSDPIWDRDPPAPFDERSHEKYRKQIQEALKEVGFEFAKYDITIQPNVKKGTADLVVQIEDEGAPATISKIHISGNQKNSRDEVIDYLKLREGTVLSRDERIRISRKLWDSGRFADFKVLTEPSKDQTSVELVLRLAEYEKAPKLNEPFSRVEKSLLKLRDWLSNFSKQPHDFVATITYNGIEFETILSPNRGILWAFREQDQPSGDFIYVTSLSHDSIALYSPKQSRKFVTPPIPYKMGFQLRLSLDDVPPWENKFKLNFGLPISGHDGPGPPPPFQFLTRLEPSHFVATAHERNWDFEFDTENLICKTENATGYIDVKTGRLVSLDVDAKDKENGTVSVRILTEIGAFERVNKGAKKACQSFPNFYKSDEPVSSTLGFIFSDEFITKNIKFAAKQKNAESAAEEYERRRLLLSRLATSGLLRPIDDWMTGPKKKKDKRFNLPGGKHLGESLNGMVSVGALLVLVHVDEIFPRESWPWTLARESAFVVLKKSQHGSRELKQLYENGDSGPLCHLSIASLLKLANNKASAVFAKRGLERLVVADFQHDFELLLAEDYWVGNFVAHAAGVFREMEEDDLRTLSNWLFPENQNTFHRAIEILRERRDEPVLEVMPDVLGQLWDAGLRNHVEWALRDSGTIKK